MRDANDPAWLENMMAMRRLSKEEQPDMMKLGAVQCLADLIVDLGARINDEERAILLGIGSMLVRDAEHETIAGFHAHMALQRARRQL